jgi:hypothetical protein
MANFLITTAGADQAGTKAKDVFDFTTANLVTMRGLEGNDIFTAGDATLGNNLVIGGNLGNDTINVGSGATINGGGLYGGGDDDVLNIGALYSATNKTIINGGGGADSIIISAGMTLNAGSRINLNGGKDFLTASSLTVASAFLGLGGGADKIELVSGIFTNSTIAAGGGNDVISASFFTASATRVEGDTVGDTEFYGNDLLAFSASNFVAGSLVQGGGGADTLQIGSIGSATIAGNAGKDTIEVSAMSVTGGAFIAGGAGADYISADGTISGVVGTINGGGQNDVINYTALAGLNNDGASATYIDGGEGADKIGLGTTTGGATLLYSSVANSNVTTFDTVSAGAVSGDLVVANVGGIVGTASAINGIANNTFSGTNGIVAFTSTYTDSLTARVVSLDSNVAKGSVGLFVDNSGFEYLFLQGGAQNGGTADDLIFKYTAGGAASAIAIANNTSVTIFR